MYVLPLAMGDKCLGLLASDGELWPGESIHSLKLCHLETYNCSLVQI